MAERQLISPSNRELQRQMITYSIVAIGMPAAALETLLTHIHTHHLNENHIQPITEFDYSSARLGD